MNTWIEKGEFDAEKPRHISKKSRCSNGLIFRSEKVRPVQVTSQTPEALIIINPSHTNPQVRTQQQADANLTISPTTSSPASSSLPNQYTHPSLQLQTQPPHPPPHPHQPTEPEPEPETAHPPHFPQAPPTHARCGTAASSRRPRCGAAAAPLRASTRAARASCTRRRPAIWCRWGARAARTTAAGGARRARCA